MSLFSLQFVVLLGITLLVYYIVPKKYQWIALLAASMIFYAFSGVVNLLFIGITSLSTWIAGRMMFRFTLEFKEAKKKEGISKEQKKELKAVLTRKKKRTLFLVLLINFGILAYLKYWQVLYDGLWQMLHPDRRAVSLGLLLPLGISFYTFQSMGYLIDQYRDSGEGEKNFFKFLLFVSFFPQLIQGPIGRYDALAHQLRQPAEQRRPFRVHMHHVIIAQCRAQAAEETCGNRRQPLLLDGWDVLEGNAVVTFGLRLLLVGSVIARHGMPLRHHTLGQFAHHNLDAAIAGRYALMSDHGNFHILPSHPLQPPLLLEISLYAGERTLISSPDAFRCTFRCHLMR